MAGYLRFSIRRFVGHGTMQGVLEWNIGDSTVFLMQRGL